MIVFTVKPSNKIDFIITIIIFCRLSSFNHKSVLSKRKPTVPLMNPNNVETVYILVTVIDFLTSDHPGSYIFCIKRAYRLQLHRPHSSVLLSK